MTKNKKKISIVAGCFNEKNNLQEFYDRLIAVFKRFPQYDYEIIIADNCSTDGSRDVLRQIAIRDRKFKVILNSNNFGSIRSPHNAFLQATGDAVVAMVSDLQDPPEIIIDMIRQWEAGYLVVIAVKPKTKENFLIGLTRKFYYRLLDLSSSSEMIKNFTGFGLYVMFFKDSCNLLMFSMRFSS